jgi:parallel beta-helix repeat protein
MSAQFPPLSKKCLSVTLIIFCSAVLSYSATVEIHPGQDIPSIVAANPAGTTYVIYPGTYRLTEHIVPKNGDTYIGQTSCAPPATSCPAILSGARLIGSEAKLNGGVYEVTGQTQQGSVPMTNVVCQPGYLACNLPEDLFFDGVPYQHLNASSLPAIGAKQWWFDYNNHTIYFHDNPAGHTVETSVLDTAFLSTANNVTINFLTIEGFAAPLQRAAIEPTNGNIQSNQGANWTVEHCDIFNNHGGGVRIGYGWQVKWNYIHSNGIVGAGGSTSSPAASNVVVQGNNINNNNYARGLSDWGAGGFKVGYTANLVLRNNKVSNNDGTGIHFDTTSINPLIDGNTVTGNAGGGGIEYEVSVNSAVIRNNIVLRNNLPDLVPVSAAGIGSYASVGTSTYCNIVEVPNANSANGINVVGSDRGYNPYSPFEYLMSTGNTFHHNTVFWDEGARGTVGFSFGDAVHQPLFFSSNPPPDYNMYHLVSASDANFVYDNNLTQKNARKTFTEYQAAGADVHGTADANYNKGYPSVRISSPADQSSFTGPITIQATASDKSGINRVEFFVDWKLQTTVAGPPYNFSWTNATTGTHTVAAMAYSNAGIGACFAVTLTKQ